jgi:hypothetical protein
MNIVRERILEFQRGQNPSDVLKLGKKKELDAWLRQHLPSVSYTINSDWTVDLKRDFIMPKSSNIMYELPEFIQFNECFGDFLIRDQYLKTMKGCPYFIHGDFMVDGNKIEDLEGCPKRVDGNFFIKRNTTKFTKEQIQKLCQVGEMIIC